jgi:methylenetetrahydrofolate dehydrogenase (NADP+)/methenyltetrahydrofolate cyclohydrolase
MKMAKILDGKAVAARIREEVRREIEAFKAEFGTVPGLTVIIVGDDPASKVYVGNKHKACGELGIASEVIRLPADTGEADLIAAIDRLNADAAVHGILVQLPLPKHINAEKVLERIRPDKDVDGFHPLNAGNLAIGREALVPCTPNGVVKMLEMEGIAVEGKRAVIIGRSNIVGKPMFHLLLARTPRDGLHFAHQGPGGRLPGSDILVAAHRQPNFVTADHGQTRRRRPRCRHQPVWATSWWATSTSRQSSGGGGHNSGVAA